MPHDLTHHRVLLANYQNGHHAIHIAGTGPALNGTNHHIVDGPPGSGLVYECAARVAFPLQDPAGISFQHIGYVARSGGPDRVKTVCEAVPPPAPTDGPARPCAVWVAEAIGALLVQGVLEPMNDDQPTAVVRREECAEGVALGMRLQEELGDDVRGFLTSLHGRNE